jgi:hypothetical protein
MRHLPDTLLLTAIALGAHLVLRQDAVHHLDMHGVMRSLVAPPGEPGHYAHFGFQWLALALHRLLGPEAPLYPALQAVVACTSAAAVGVGHRACLAAGLDRIGAFAAALGAAGTLACLHFATVVEIHGVFALPAAVAWWLLARLVGEPAVGAALALGAGTACATAVHNSGHLLAVLVPLALWAARWPERIGWRRTATLAAATLLAHVAVFVLLRLVDRATVARADDEATGWFLRATLERFQGFAALPAVLRREWLLPMAPWSLGFVLALRVRSLRPAVAACALAVLGYWLVDWLLLVDDVDERGAYALPLALPAAALTVVLLRRWPVPVGPLALALALAAAAVPAVLRVRSEDRARVPDPAFGRAVAAWAQLEPRAVLVLGLWPEIDSVLVHARPLWNRTIVEPPFVPLWDPTAGPDAVQGAFAALLAKARARGGPLVFSAGAEAVLRQSANPHTQALLRDLPARCRVEPIAAGAFTGLAVRPL